MGKKIAFGTPRDLIASIHCELTWWNFPPATDTDPLDLAALLRRIEGIREVRVDAGN